MSKVHSTDVPNADYLNQVCRVTHKLGGTILDDGG